eukprot:13487209-Alexandrium_andersonii.AAC.1
MHTGTVSGESGRTRAQDMLALALAQHGRGAALPGASSGPGNCVGGRVLEYPAEVRTKGHAAPGRAA